MLSNGACLEQRLRAPKAPGGVARGQPRSPSDRPGAWMMTPKGPRCLTKNLPNIQLSSDNAATNTRGDPKRKLTEKIDRHSQRGSGATHLAPRALLPLAAPRQSAGRALPDAAMFLVSLFEETTLIYPVRKRTQLKQTENTKEKQSPT